MKNTLQLLSVLVLCSFFTSCKKDLVEPMAPVTPYDSVTRLSKLINFDQFSSATDTSSYSEFIYDSLQRVIAINSYEYSNGIPSIIDIGTYYYIGGDSLPYKNIQAEVGTPNIDTTFYFYDNLKRLVKDSVIDASINNSREVITSYNYSASRIIVVNDASGYITTDTGFIGSTGDVVKTINVQAGIGRDVTSYFSYDTNPNPFYQLNIRATYEPVPNFAFDIFSEYLQKNNVVQQIDQDLLFAGSMHKATYTYTYNASGLPETVSISDDNGQTINEKIVFVYKKL